MKHFSSIVFFFCLLSGSLISQSFYDVSTIQKIEIKFDQDNWDYQMDTARMGKDGFIKAAQIKINGISYNNVGVKYKGNSSYSPNNNKNPLHIELDTYQEQDYQGFKDIKLGNNYADPSMIREVLAYNILKNYMDCPQSNFAKVYINGAYYGVYSNTESITRKFYGEHFYSSDNTAIKCNPTVTPGSATKCNLKYNGEDSTSYFNFYELKSETGWNELVRLCDTITNFPSRLENNIDIDRAIWMLAFNSALVNLDSYSGAFCQNYYLYKDNNKRFLPIVWDLNMSFGGFPFVGSGTVSLGGQSISGLQQLSLNLHSTDVHWPLINKIHANPTYKRMYAAHVKTIINEMIATGVYTTNATQYQTLIDTSVLSDPYKSFTYTQFQNGLTANVSVGSYSVPGISTLMNVRKNYLQAQSEFTLTAPTVTNIGYSSPSFNSVITITATINNASYTYLAYRTKNANRFSKIEMLDDGMHQDGLAGDNIFGASFLLNANQAEYYIYSENSDAGIFSPARAEYEFHEVKIHQTPAVGDVVINEFLANNNSDVRNEFNLLEDWIELYNNTNSTISLCDYYLSNQNSNRSSYAFPANTVIQPKSYLMVWADKITLTGSQLHANFKLDEDGDNIILSNGRSIIIDSYSFLNQIQDESTGRCPDGNGSFRSMKLPTYSTSNCVVGLEENLSEQNLIRIYPNPAKESFVVITNQSGTRELFITNIIGDIILTQKVQDKTIINTNNWPNGIYIVNFNGATKKLIINH